MVPKRIKARLTVGGTLVLDAQGLSPLIDQDQRMRAIYAKATNEGVRVAVSAVTPLEVQHTGQATQRAAFVLSQITVKPVTDAVVNAAGVLLQTSGLDGHECLVDALVVATAALSAPPVRLITSDSSQIPELAAAASALPG